MCALPACVWVCGLYFNYNRLNDWERERKDEKRSQTNTWMIERCWCSCVVVGAGGAAGVVVVATSITTAVVSPAMY